ncbi:MAG: hypothetical protein LIO65_01480, partial [Odoribacter sp.]|nr:hypothetical protein [Odoribacter sp.]
MAIDIEYVKKIIAGVVGAGAVVGVVSSLIEKMIDRGEPYVPSYSGNNRTDSSETNDDDEDDEGYYDYSNVSAADEIFEEDGLQAEIDSIWDDYRADNIWQEHSNGAFQEKYSDKYFVSAQHEFEEKNNRQKTDFIYLDFTQNLKCGSHRNRNDVYQESIEDQFEKIQRKLALYWENYNKSLEKFVKLCFPMVKSKYYVSLPSFKRKRESAEHYQGSDCIYNMVLRPAKTKIIEGVIPKELDLILAGDLVFRNNLISFVVKGIDLIDENVKKFGELPIECAAACAIKRNSRNLPDYGIESRDLYKPFLTRDMVLSLCEKVYPIEHPEKAIEIFEKWGRYLDFRSYFLNIQSQRNEKIERVELVNAYVVSRSDYNKNENIYSQYLLDGNKGFIQKERVLLSETTEDSVEFPLVRVEIVRNLAEISKDMVKNKKITNFERELRRFTKVQVALSKNNPREETEFDHSKDLVYLGDRVTFVAENILPDCEDVIQFFDKNLREAQSQIDENYIGIIKSAIEEYRKNEGKRIEDECSSEIKEYCESLDKKLE